MASGAAALLKQAPGLAGFDLKSLDRFVDKGFAVTADIQAENRRAPGGPPAYYEDYGVKPLEWGTRMLAAMGAEEIRAGAMLFHLHQLPIQQALGAGNTVIGLRDNVDGLIFHEAESPIPFSDADRALLLASAMAIRVSTRQPAAWVPSFHADRSDWISFGGPAADPSLKELCRQLAEGRVWLHATGLFEPRGEAPAVPSPLKVNDLAQNWRYHLRSLVVQALGRGWISADQAERITGTHPLHEPWWLLSRTPGEVQAMTPALRDFTLHLRERFAARLAELPGRADPETLINIRLDSPSAEDSMWAGAEGGSAELLGSASLIAAARWAESHPDRMGRHEADAGTHVVRRLAFIKALDASESADAVVTALKAVPAKGLALILPWANQAQPLVLRALGLEAAEPLRAWLLRYAGGDPAYSKSHGAFLENTPDPRADVADLATLKAALQGVTPSQRKALLAPYAKVGLLSGADKLLAAVTGEADRGKLMEAAGVKEQQPAIKLLGLLPAQGDDDVEERYLLLQKLAKQASRHGAQRQATQRAAVEVGLAHLAQVAGYADAGDLEWTMEARRGGELQASFAARAIDGHEAWIAIEDLKPVLRVRNAAGKILASVPAALKKHADMQALQETFAEVKEQLRRFTRLMDKRMTLEAPVSRGQLVAGLAHPVMAPIVRSLVWIDESGYAGFFDAAGLTGPDGTRAASGETLRVAHSAHLLQAADGAALLSRWQRWLVEGRRVQAFKQVFREIYVPTPAELEAGEESARYSGRTIRTGVAQGLLQSRGWVAAAGDATVQRLMLRNGVTANCAFAVGHYFTEGEEAETFAMWFDRGGERIALRDVPAIAFSEAMRDIDLVVSRAALDGDDADTRTSMATMAARADLLRALAPALGDGVLEFDESHVRVRGQLASYRIHLASGNIHIEPGAYLCIIPDPVTANRHDPVQLPFAEDDRKTAEIVSKVFLLARDDRIKDESILAQIRRGK